MKKLYMALAAFTTLGVVGAGTAAAKAANGVPERPAWVLADGRADYSKMPDTAQIPYTCWNGKSVALSGKTVKQKAQSHAMPGSNEHQLGIAKSKELSSIPGVVARDARGGEVVTIDETNPAVVSVMQKYELLETPQCK
jgi:hypothetical protein